MYMCAGAARVITGVYAEITQIVKYMNGIRSAILLSAWTGVPSGVFCEQEHLGIGVRNPDTAAVLKV